MPLYAVAIGLSDNQMFENRMLKQLSFPVKVRIDNNEFSTRTFVVPVDYDLSGFFIERFIYQKREPSLISQD